jgi:hypothetical protein
MRIEWGAVCALAIGALFAGCAEKAQVEQAESTWPTAVVMETMDGGGYTYAQVELDGKEMWVAGPVTPLKVGDTVTLVDTMFMGSFPSKALDRTFDELVFVMSFRGDEAAPTRPAGTAVQVIAAGGYTYVEVETEEGKFWLAGPETEITQGTRVQWKGPMLMRDFHSSSLDRTFSEIVFVDNVWMTDESGLGASPDARGD